MSNDFQGDGSARQSPRGSENPSMIERVKQSDHLDEEQKSEVLENIIQEATAETRQQE